MSDTVIRGSACVFGDFVSADAILPARYAMLGPDEIAAVVLAEHEPTANARVRANPILIAGNAFGYGTGRESSARALRAAGVRAVVGGPFARMFFRNAINNGILVVECPAVAAAGIADGDAVAIDTDASVVRWQDRSFAMPPVAPFVLDVIAAGSLIEYGRRIVAAEGAP